MGIDSAVAHRQVWVKVNAPVDDGIAELVSILSKVEGLQTLESCQGEPAVNPQGRPAPAYIYFYLGGWQTVCQFAFGMVAPELEDIDGAAISVEVFSNSPPMAKLTVATSSVFQLAERLNHVVSRRKNPCSHGMECRALGSC